MTEHVAELREAPSIRVEQQYGVLPWRKDKRGHLQVLLITSRGGGRWIVPKGWPVKGRAPYLSAALEAFEEAGVIGEVVSQPLASYRYAKDDEDGTKLLRRVTLFGLRVVGTLTNWPERGQRKRRWFSLADAAEAAADPELSTLIRAIRDEPQMLLKPS